jgi:hypothetical protein
VDNIVDKPTLVPCQPRIHAVFNKMPVLEAKNKVIKIRHLATKKFASTVPMGHFPTSPITGDKSAKRRNSPPFMRGDLL